jgi:hypothetical protein
MSVRERSCRYSRIRMSSCLLQYRNWVTQTPRQIHSNASNGAVLAWAKWTMLFPGVPLSVLTEKDINSAIGVSVICYWSNSVTGKGMPSSDTESGAYHTQLRDYITPACESPARKRNINDSAKWIALIGFEPYLIDIPIPADTASSRTNYVVSI